jgi:hypothetical protein
MQCITFHIVGSILKVWALDQSQTTIAGSNSARGMDVGGPFDKFMDWRQCAAVMQREAVIVMPSCSDAGNVVVAWSASLQTSLEFELRSF